MRYKCLFNINIYQLVSDCVFFFWHTQIDPNIAETGEQLIKSNNGPDACCYQYCSQESVYHSICTFCNLSTIGKANSLTGFNTTATEDTMDIFEKAFKYSKSNIEFPPQTCQLVPGLSLTTSRCEIPYYASSTASVNSPYNWITTSRANNKYVIYAQCQAIFFALKYILHSFLMP